MKFINSIILLTSPDNISDGGTTQTLDSDATWLIFSVVLLLILVGEIIYILHLKDVINGKFPPNNDSKENNQEDKKEN